MYKFFVNEEQINDNKVEVIGEDINHIKNVLRLQIGESLCICSRQTAQSYNCKITKISNESVECEILEEIQETPETGTYIHIFQGLPKADKFEWIIEKCTEIGVKEITPIIMKRTIVKLDEKDKIKKINRWQKIAEVASKQSKRDCLLKVNNIINFENIFEIIKGYDIVLVAYENEKKNKIKNVLKSITCKSTKIAVIIGPEGGIDENEIEICERNNVIPITLGKRILRTETAPLVVSSNILYELED